MKWFNRKLRANIEANNEAIDALITIAQGLKEDIRKLEYRIDNPPEFKSGDDIAGYRIIYNYFKPWALPKGSEMLRDIAYSHVYHCYSLQHGEMSPVVEFDENTLKNMRDNYAANKN